MGEGGKLAQLAGLDTNAGRKKLWERVFYFREGGVVEAVDEACLGWA